MKWKDEGTLSRLYILFLSICGISFVGVVSTIIYALNEFNKHF